MHTYIHTYIHTHPYTHRSTASSSGEGSSSPPPTSEVAGRLLLTFRQEKVRLLRECGAKFRAYSQRLASGVREKEGKREA
jgi:hypothetical protein